MEGVGKWLHDGAEQRAGRKGAAPTFCSSRRTRRERSTPSSRPLNAASFTRARIDSARRDTCLELKARSGAAASPIMSLEALREIVGAPGAPRACVADIAAPRGHAAARSRRSRSGRRYRAHASSSSMRPETEIKAGRVFRRRAAKPARCRWTAAPARSGRANRADSPRQALDSIGRMAATQARRIVAASCGAVEGEGRVAMPQPIGRD